MANNKVYLVVMVACLDAPLVIQNNMEVMQVLVNLSRLLLDMMVDQQKLYTPLEAYLHANSQILFPLEFMV
jgi:hypothetical protein